MAPKTHKLSAKTANKTFISEYCERIDNNAVNTPAPINKGKTTGTIVASPETSAPSQNTLTSNIISILIKKTISEPAIAKEEISSPKSFKNASPA